MDYLELYYAYLERCERENWANMRDPNHDYMEWNHALPRCIFGDQPIGQWLTIEQHAVASALQTLAYKTQCHCGWHKDHMPETLWKLSEYCILGARQSLGSRNGKLAGKFNLTDEGRGKGIETQKKLEVGFFSPEFQRSVDHSKAGKIGGKITHERGAGLFGMEENEKLQARSKGGKKGGYAGLNSDPDFRSERGRKGGKKTANTRAVCLKTGFESNISGLTRYQKSRGIDTSFRRILN